MERNPTIYTSGSGSYDKFVSWSDEKERIASEINRYIQKRCESLLDIGTGNGTITAMIAQNFDNIAIIEPGKNNLELLKSKFLSEKFIFYDCPFEEFSVSQHFDVILASHSFKFLRYPEHQLQKIKDLLKDDGMFIHIDQSRDSDFLKFYDAYREKVLGESSKSPAAYDYHELFSRVFSIVHERRFDARLTIPSVEDAISILDFIYDVDYKDISPEIIEHTREDLRKKYGIEKIIINLQQTMHICQL